MGMRRMCYHPGPVKHDESSTMKNIALIALLLFGAPAWADGVPPAAQLEINHLLAYLKGSGCQFNRNGSWYTPQEAVDHLNDKYQYLIHHDMVNTTEDFIEYAATKSSWSGKPYLVKCGNTAAAETGAWFRTELQKYRKAGTSASATR